MSFLGGILGGGGDGTHSGIAQALLSHLSDPQSGGVQGLLSKFQSAGLGDKAQSWVGTGENQPVAPDEVERGLGSGTVQALAQKAGIPEGVASQALAAVLPMVIDRLTPNGQVPSQGSIGSMIGSVLGHFGK